MRCPIICYANATANSTWNFAKILWKTNDATSHSVDNWTASDQTADARKTNSQASWPSPHSHFRLNLAKHFYHLALFSLQLSAVLHFIKHFKQFKRYRPSCCIRHQAVLLRPSQLSFSDCKFPIRPPSFPDPDFGNLELQLREIGNRPAEADKFLRIPCCKAGARLGQRVEQIN